MAVMPIIRKPQFNLNDINFTGGTELNEGESMTFVNGTDLGIDEAKVNVTDEFTAGVAVIGTGEVVSDTNSVKYVLKEVKQNKQIDLVRCARQPQQV